MPCFPASDNQINTFSIIPKSHRPQSRGDGPTPVYLSDGGRVLMGKRLRRLSAGLSASVSSDGVSTEPVRLCRYLGDPAEFCRSEFDILVRSLLAAGRSGKVPAASRPRYACPVAPRGRPRSYGNCFEWREMRKLQRVARWRPLGTGSRLLVRPVDRCSDPFKARF